MTTNRIDGAKRVIHASKESIYRALLDGSARSTWLPPDGMTARMERFDPRPGGGYRMVLTYEDPEGPTGKSSRHSDVVEGRFLELVRNEHVVEAITFESEDAAFAGTMTMTWTLTSVASGTEVHVAAVDVPEGISAEDHRAGMRSSLDNLAGFVESRPQPDQPSDRAPAGGKVTVHDVVPGEQGPETAVRRARDDARSRALIRLGSRAGVWGIAGGFGCIIAFSLGAPISLPLAMTGLAAGLVVGGAGTALASTLVYRRAAPENRLLRIGSLLGIPLGGTLTVVGLATLLGWSIVNAAGGLALSMLGVVVLVLFIVGFILHGRDRDDAAQAGDGG